MTPRALELLRWHAVELAALLARCAPDSFAYPRIEARLSEVKSLMR